MGGRLFKTARSGEGVLQVSCCILLTGKAVSESLNPMSARRHSRRDSAAGLHARPARTRDLARSIRPNPLLSCTPFKMFVGNTLFSLLFLVTYWLRRIFRRLSGILDDSSPKAGAKTDT